LSLRRVPAITLSDHQPALVTPPCRDIMSGDVTTMNTGPFARWSPWPPADAHRRRAGGGPQGPPISPMPGFRTVAAQEGSRGDGSGHAESAGETRRKP
jgi:hypothetical protein